MRTIRILPTVCSTATTCAITVAPAAAQLEWSTKDGNASVKIGILAQLQGESAEIAGTDDSANNIFLRRLRFIANFTWGEELSFFAETDSPNLGKGANDGTKNAGDIFLQDAAATWKLSHAVQLDAGLLLTEQSYNHNQSAASLMALDYGPFTFVESGPTESRVGRDYGLRARGYLFGDHLEYRAGIYQGERGDNASNEFRYIGRLMMQWFTPQIGLFYRGTSLGKTRSLAVGASVDTQEDYDSLGADLFFEQPFGDGNGFVLQTDYTRIDGDVFLPTLPERTNLLVESGVYLGDAQLQPFVQYSSQDMDDDELVDEARLTVGLAYFPGGHGNNLKLSFTHVDPSGGESSDQIHLQWQLFQF